MINWLSQSFFGMDKTERIARIVIEVGIFFFLFSMFFFFIRLHYLILIIIAFLISNTISWYLFSNVYLHIIHNYKLKSVNKKDLEIYFKNLTGRANGNQAISCIAAFGSMSRGEFHKHSDIDLRIIRKQGLKNGLRAIGFIVYERLTSQKKRIPLEVLLGDSISFLKKMREDEPPIIIYDPDEQIKKNYKKYYTLKNIINTINF